MTEAEWLVCTDPSPMLEFLQDKASDRKLRLFAVACCRRIWPLVTDEKSRQAVALAEGYADGLADEDDLEAARADVNAVENVILYLLVPEMWLSSAVDHATSNAAERHCQFSEATDFESAYKPERVVQCRLLRDIFGNPFRTDAIDPAWPTPTVLALATAAYDNRSLPAGTLDPARLAVLADAIEDAGCTNADILNHCRQPGTHVRGCWVVDLLLGKHRSDRTSAPRSF